MCNLREEEFEWPITVNRYKGDCMVPSPPLGLSPRLERTAYGDVIQSQGHCNVGTSLGIQYKVRRPKQG